MMKMAAVMALALCACGSNSNSNASSAGSGSTALNGCSTFEDHTAASDAREVDFGTAAIGIKYSPPCMTISAGQSVTFVGDFEDHPLSPGSSPSATTTGSPNNPITTPPGSATQSVVTFPTAGSYPYYCSSHYSAGMLGVVKVQ